MPGHRRTPGKATLTRAQPAPPAWHTLRLPFAAIQPHRIERPLDLTTLRRLGLVAIGREMRVDLCLARLSLYP